MVQIIVFGFGLAVGSFLSALIERTGKGETALTGRSHCPHCSHPLAWNDLIPLFSFLWLRGRCRYCQKRIPVQDPLVELAAGLLFVGVFASTGLSVAEFRASQLAELLYGWTIVSLLLLIFVYDLKHYLIPDAFLYPALLLAFLWRLFEFGASFALWQPLLAGLGASAFFLAIHLGSKGKAMGFGDVKLALFMGIFLGWPGILVGLFLAFLAGALVGMALIGLGRKRMKSEVPFGPFLVAGTLAAFFWGEGAVDFYFGFVRGILIQ